MRTLPVLAALAARLAAAAPGGPPSPRRNIASRGEPALDHAPAPGARHGSQKAGDVELYYAVYGEGPPVVLLHRAWATATTGPTRFGPLSQESR